MTQLDNNLYLFSTDLARAMKPRGTRKSERRGYDAQD